MNTSITPNRDKIGIYISIVDVVYPRTAERRRIYLLDSTFCGKTYVDHIKEFDNMTEKDIVKELLKLSEHEGYSDPALNCERFDHKIRFESSIYTYRDLFTDVEIKYERR